jgi:hypothetical protein
MPTFAVRRPSPAATLPSGRRRTTLPDPIVVYVASSLDGTSFALDPSSQQRIRQAFPDVRVSTRHVFIAHDTHEALTKSLGRFEDQIAFLLTGLSADQLADRFNFVSFRDPRSEREVGRLPAARPRSARQA